MANGSRGGLTPDDHKDLPFEGGSEPVPHSKEPVPSPGMSAVHWIVIGVCVVIAALSLMMLFAW